MREWRVRSKNPSPQKIKCGLAEMIGVLEEESVASIPVEKRGRILHAPDHGKGIARVHHHITSAIGDEDGDGDLVQAAPCRTFPAGPS
jgi:hypothetical protein